MVSNNALTRLLLLLLLLLLLPLPPLLLPLFNCLTFLELLHVTLDYKNRMHGNRCGRLFFTSWIPCLSFNRRYQSTEANNASVHCRLYKTSSPHLQTCIILTPLTSACRVYTIQCMLCSELCINRRLALPNVTTYWSNNTDHRWVQQQVPVVYLHTTYTSNDCSLTYRLQGSPVPPELLTIR